MRKRRAYPEDIHKNFKGIRSKLPIGSRLVRYSKEETLEQEQFVYSGLVQGVETRSIKRSFGKQFPKTGLSRWSTIYARVAERMAEEDKERWALRKSEAMRRFQSRIQSLDTRAFAALKGDPEKGIEPNPKLARLLFAEVRSQESILADFTGIRAPIKIDLDVKVKETMTVLLAQMSVDMLNENLQQYKENLRLADMQRQAPKTLVMSNGTGRHSNGHGTGS